MKTPSAECRVMGADRPGLDDTLSMTIRTACAASGFSKDLLYSLINDGSIRSFLMGHRRFIDVASLRTYVAARAAEPLQNSSRPIPRRGPRDEESCADLQKSSSQPTTKTSKHSGGDVRARAPKGA
jgi:hypothetical protein